MSRTIRLQVLPPELSSRPVPDCRLCDFRDHVRPSDVGVGPRHWPSPEPTSEYPLLALFPRPNHPAYGTTGFQLFERGYLPYIMPTRHVLGFCTVRCSAPSSIKPRPRHHRICAFTYLPAFLHMGGPHPDVLCVGSEPYSTLARMYARPNTTFRYGLQHQSEVWPGPDPLPPVRVWTVHHPDDLRLNPRHSETSELILQLLQRTLRSEPIPHRPLRLRPPVPAPPVPASPIPASPVTHPSTGDIS